MKSMDAATCYDVDEAKRRNRNELKIGTLARTEVVERRNLALIVFSRVCCRDGDRRVQV